MSENQKNSYLKGRIAIDYLGIKDGYNLYQLVKWRYLKAYINEYTPLVQEDIKRDDIFEMAVDRGLGKYPEKQVLRCLFSVEELNGFKENNPDPLAPLGLRSSDSGPTQNKNKFGNQKEDLHTDAASPLGENKILNTGDSIEKIKKIEVGPDNDYQFMIRTAGKAPKPCTHHDLGCQNERTKQFKYLLEVIQQGYIYLRETNNKKTFKRACKKLTNYIKQKHIPSLPEDFIIYKEDENNNYRLILKRLKDSDFGSNQKYEKMSKEECLLELQRLYEEQPEPDIKNIELWNRTKETKIAEVSQIALEKGATHDEILDALEPKPEIECVMTEEKKDNTVFDYDFDTGSPSKMGSKNQE